MGLDQRCALGGEGPGGERASVAAATLQACSAGARLQGAARCACTLLQPRVSGYRHGF